MSAEEHLRLSRAIRCLADPKKRRAIEPVLIDCGAEAVPPLIRALEDPDQEVVCAAARVLGEIGDARAIGALSQLALLEPPEVAAAAVAALGHIPSAEGLTALDQALHSRHPTVRLEAALGLAQLTGELRGQALEALRRLHPTDVFSLGKALLTRLPPESQETVFGVALAINPEAAVGAILAGLDAKQTAQRALDLLRRPEAVRPLLDRLTPRTAARTIPVLAFLGGGLRRPPYSVRDPRVAQALDDISTALIRMLPSADRDRSAVLIEALQAVGEWATESLRQRLIEAGPRERSSVAWALKQLKWSPTPDEAGARYWIALGDLERCAHAGKEAIGPLLEELAGDALDRRDAAAIVLRRLGWRPSDRSSRLLTLIALRRWEVLRLMGETVVPTLVEALRAERRAALRHPESDRRAEIRAATIETLWHLGGPAAARAMVETMRADPSRAVQGEARLALEKLGRDGVTALTQALSMELDLAASLSREQGLSRIRESARAWLRLELVLALGRTRSLASLGILLRTVSRDPAPTTRAAASDAVHRLWLTAPRRVTEAILGSLDQRTTPELGQTLQRLGERARNRLLAFITSSHGPSVRRAIAGFVALGQAGHDVVGPLKDLLLSGSPQARLAVARVFDRLSIEPDAPDLQAACWLAKGDMGRCEALGTGAIPVLMKALPVYDWKEAGAIALSLVRMGIRPDHPALGLTMARLRLVSDLEDERVTQTVEVSDGAIVTRQPVTLQVSHHDERRAARTLMAAIDKAWAEQIRRISRQLEWS